MPAIDAARVAPDVFPFTRNEAQIGALRTASRAWSEGAERFWAFDDVLAALQRPGSLVFFAAPEPAAAWDGVVLADVGPFSAELLYIWTRAERRRAGVGAALLRRLIAELAARPQVEALFLEVRRSNAAAQALYRRLGLVDVGERRRYYRDGEDALVLRLDFSR